MQENYVLSFLQPQYPKIADIAYSIEKSVYNDPHEALVKTRLFGEAVAKEIWDKENLQSVYEIKHVERIHKLFREGIINETFLGYFDLIRTIGNKAIHDAQYGSIVDSIRMYRIVFKIAVWFIESYGNVNFQTPKYRDPEMPQKTAEVHNDELTELLSKTVEEVIEKSIQTTIQEVFAHMMIQQQMLNVDLKKQEETEVVISNEKKTEQVLNTTFDLITYLQKHNVDVIDKREFGGTLWVLGGWELNELLFPLKEKKIFFRYKEKGNRTTKGKPAWFLFGPYVTNKKSKTTNKKKEIMKFDLITYLKKQNVEIIDKRNRGGTLWIIGGWELNKILFPLKEHNIYFRYIAKGNRATKNKPGWFLMGK
ncbi:hypothetical protein [Bacillus sp. BP-3]|uniref:hypothetical protein n=1 Tax=Bacillus sp. BP-3 TaxID=3022773 RepID=UPI00232C0D29|nr:hypothetical protein [Bacillus sp. BP-3]MDC2864341.1 hypothetical protein [Bacillus sp. BP-3]